MFRRWIGALRKPVFWKTFSLECRKRKPFRSCYPGEECPSVCPSETLLALTDCLEKASITFGKEYSLVCCDVFLQSKLTTKRNKFSYGFASVSAQSRWVWEYISRCSSRWRWVAHVVLTLIIILSYFTVKISFLKEIICKRNSTSFYRCSRQK